jgi:hypothetical protein
VARTVVEKAEGPECIVHTQVGSGNAPRRGDRRLRLAPGRPGP